FAAIWWMIGAAQSGRDSLMMYAVGIAISAFLIAVDRWQGGPSAAREERRRWEWIVAMAGRVEGVTILAAAAALANRGRRDLIGPVAAIIVGLHFLSLAQFLSAPIYYFTAALLVAAGMACARQIFHPRPIDREQSENNFPPNTTT